MKKIKLTNSSQTAMVDDEDYGWLNQYEWSMDDEGYAVTKVGGKIIHMENMIVRGAEIHGRINPDGTLNPRNP